MKDRLMRQLEWIQREIELLRTEQAADDEAARAQGLEMGSTEIPPRSFIRKPGKA